MLSDFEVGDLAGRIAFCLAVLLPSKEDEESDDDDREESEDWQGAWDVFCKEILELINKR